MHLIHDLAQAQTLLQKGCVIAYPTEAVYGLGCDPFNKQAVDKLNSLKQREAAKGYILLISSWEQLAELIQPIPETNMQRVRATWPGPVTWIFPKSSKVPEWLTGNRSSIAVRMTAHPLARALCLNGPIVSTSANVSGVEPAKNIEQLQAQFPHDIEACLIGELGGASKPSQIFDAISGAQLR